MTEKNFNISYDLISKFSFVALKECFIAKDGKLNLCWGNITFPAFANKLYEILGNEQIINEGSRFQRFMRPNTGLEYKHDFEGEFYLEDLIRLVFTDFVSMGILIPCYIGLGRLNDTQNYQLDSSIYKLSPFGIKCLEENQFHIYDKSGYICDLKSKIPNLNETIEIYFDDALSCFKTNNYRASVILIGAASEKLVLLLCESIVNYLTRSGITVNNDFQANNISRKFSAVKNHIMSNKGTIPKEFYDGLENRLIAVFENIRLSRNEAGHPEVNYKFIDRNAAQAYLLLFPSYCELIYNLIDWFDNEKN